MTALEVLERCRTAERETRRMKLRIRQRQDAAECISPAMNHAGGGHGSGPKDAMAENVVDIDRLTRTLKDREERYAAELSAACVLLDMLTENTSDVLHRYYVKREKIASIAAALGYTDGYIRRLKIEGEQQLADFPQTMVEAALPAWYLREYGTAVSVSDG